MGALNTTRAEDRLTVDALTDSIVYIAEELTYIQTYLSSSYYVTPKEEAVFLARQAQLRKALIEAELRLSELIAHPAPSSPSEKTRSGRISKAPGHYLLRIAEFAFSKKTFTEVFEPTIRDLRDEYNEALLEGRSWKARWVRSRGYWSFLNAAGLTSIVGVGKNVVKLWKLVG